jgi:hypothetical protein
MSQRGKDTNRQMTEMQVAQRQRRQELVSVTQSPLVIFVTAESRREFTDDALGFAIKRSFNRSPQTTTGA